MLTEHELSAAIGSTAYGPDGDKIGTVEHFFIDDRTGVPSWVAVTTGLFGTRHSVVPALDATFADGVLLVPVTRDAVKRAPEVGDASRLEPEDEAVLLRHYGLGPTAAAPTMTSPAAPPAAAPTPPAAPPAAAPPPEPPLPPDPPVAPTQRITPASAPPPESPLPPPAAPAAAPPAPAAAPPAAPATGGATEPAMTRSEERLRVGTEQVAATRVRLVKYVVTEEVQITVPIRREEIRVEHVPIDAPDEGPEQSLAPDDRVAAQTAGSSGLPDEIILHTERPVVTVEVVPTERVRLRTEVVAGQEQLTEQLQRELIAVEQSPAPGRHEAVEQSPPPGTRLA